MSGCAAQLNLKQEDSTTQKNKAEHSSSAVRLRIQAPEKPAVINNSGPRQQVDARMAAAPPASKEVRARFAREKPFCLDWIESIA